MSLNSAGEPDMEIKFFHAWLFLFDFGQERRSEKYGKSESENPGSNFTAGALPLSSSGASWHISEHALRLA